MKRILFAIIMCIGVNLPVLADFRGHFEAGQQSLLQNQFSTAIIEFKKALRINYLDNSTRVGLINAYLARGAYYGTTAEDWEAAANDFRAALFYMQYYLEGTSAPNQLAIISQANNNLDKCLQMQNFDLSPSNRFKKASELRQAGKFAESAYEYNKAAMDDMYKEESFIQLADIFKLMGNEEASIPYYKKALDINKHNGPVRLKFARTLDRLNKEDEAVSQYNLALMQSGEDPEILYALERIYLKKIQKSPNDAELYANLGAIKQKQKDFETALRYYAKAEQINPTNVQTRLNIGTLYQQQQDYVKALQSYNSILVLYPDNVEANLYKAQALEATGDKRQAYDAYKKVLAIEPENTFAKSKVSELVLEGMSPNEIVAYLRNSVSKNPEMINTLYEHAIDLHKNDKIDDAIKFYREVIKYDSQKEDAYVNLAICYGQKSDYDRAKQILQVAQSKFPNNSQVKSTLADIEADNKSDKLVSAVKSYEKGDYTSALNYYLAIQPATKDSLLGVAACYQGLKQFDGAIEYYKKAAKLVQDASEINYYIGAMYVEKGDYVNAENYLKPIVQKVPQANELLTFISQKASVESLELAIKDYENGAFDDALEKLNKIIDTDDKNAYAKYYRAMVYDAKNERLKAVEDYKNVILLAPDIVIANYLLAIDYDNLQKFVDAYKAYKDFVDKYSTEDEYRAYSQKRLEDLKLYAEEG